MVSRAGWNADERESVPAGGGRDHGQGPVAAGHAQRVGAARDRLADDRCEVLARFQDDGLDPLLARVLGERCARGTAAARARVDQQDRPAGRSGRSPGGSERGLHAGHGPRRLDERSSHVVGDPRPDHQECVMPNHPAASEDALHDQHNHPKQHGRGRIRRPQRDRGLLRGRPQCLQGAEHPQGARGPASPARAGGRRRRSRRGRPGRRQGPGRIVRPAGHGGRGPARAADRGHRRAARRARRRHLRALRRLDVRSLRRG